MQQRRLRLGDILDDYCPRERRITNHAVVAMVDDDVKRTRCTTCDADHDYKQAKAPSPRRKKPVGALFGEAEGAAGSRPVLAAASAPAASEPHDADLPSDVLAASDIDSGNTSFEASDFTDDHHVAADGLDDAAGPIDESIGQEEIGNDIGGDDIGNTDLGNTIEDDGPVHRRLIRATLPRPEGQTPERKAPDFTMRQPGGRFNQNRNGAGGHGNHRQARPGQGNANGSARFGGPRQPAGGHGTAQGPRHGNRPGQNAGHRSRPPGPGPHRSQRPGGSGQGRKRGR